MTPFYRNRPHPWHGKIVAVLEKDLLWGAVESIEQLPAALVERLRHYFSTYELVVGEPPRMIVEAVHDRDHAFRVIEAAREDYRAEFGEPSTGAPAS